jgi:hypothetical protein
MAEFKGFEIVELIEGEHEFRNTNKIKGKIFMVLKQ